MLVSEHLMVNLSRSYFGHQVSWILKKEIESLRLISTSHVLVHPKKAKTKRALLLGATCLLPLLTSLTTKPALRTTETYKI